MNGSKERETQMKSYLEIGKIVTLHGLRGDVKVQGQVHRADGLILTLPLQMRKVAIYPVDEVRDMIRKVRCNLCTLLLGSSVGTSALFLRFDFITECTPVP